MTKLGTVALLTVLVVGAASNCWAETVPSFPSSGDIVNGYSAVHLYTRDRDQSTGYIGDDDTYTRSTPGGSWSSVGGGSVSAFTSPDQKFMTNEDSWGIFSLIVLEAGQANPDDIVQKGVEVTYEWTQSNYMTGDTALVGVFYGGWDSKVVLSQDGNALQVNVEQVQFELWAVDKSAVNLEVGSIGPHYDPNWRTAANRYTTWVEGGGILLLTGESTFFRFIGSQLGTGPFAFDGQTVAYWDVNSAGLGAWDAAIGENKYFTDPNGSVADMKMSFDIDPGALGWSVNSHDDGGFLFAVPEPLTLVGLAVSAAGVGNYLRRRRLAKA